jgi:SAM-dependent methyltransferase
LILQRELSMSHDPIAYHAWEAMAQAYADRLETKAHNAYYERPAVLSLLPDLPGMRVLDAGCGPGLYADILTERGARVVGLDRSPQMVALAHLRAGDRAAFLQADLGTSLPFTSAASFDLVLSSLTLHYVKDWRLPFREFYRLLRPGGWLVASVGHPFADYDRFRPEAHYFEVERIEETWTGFGAPTKVASYRRPLEATVNPVIAAGFHLDRILEPRPTEAFEAQDPEDYELLIREPGFLCLRAKKE